MADITPAAGTREARLIAMMNEHEEALLRMCAVYLRDAALAEDAVQDTFVKAYRAMDAFRGGSSEKTWLMRIAINTCKDMRKGAWFRHVDHRVALDNLPAPLAAPSGAQSDLALTVMELPQKHLEAVLLHYYQGMTVREVAQALGIPHQTVSSRLKRAREALRATLEEV